MRNTILILCILALTGCTSQSKKQSDESEETAFNLGFHHQNRRCHRKGTAIHEIIQSGGQYRRCLFGNKKYI